MRHPNPLYPPNLRRYGYLMDRRIKFRHIEAFIEITRQGSLKGAAEILGLTQPAISKSLRELEDTLGAQLLMRGRAGIALTTEGEAFVQFAELSLRALKLGLDSLDTLRRGGRERLVVGALPSAAARFMPTAARHFSALSPGTLLQVEDGPHGHLVDRLRRGDIELLVGRLGNHAQMDGISFTQLYLEEAVFVARPGHPARHAISLREIERYPLIYPPKGAAIRDQLDRIVLASGADLDMRVETISGAFGRNMARDSDMIWVISRGVVAPELDAGTLVTLPIDCGLTLGPVGLMRRADQEPSPLSRLFTHAAQKSAGELGLTGSPQAE